MIYRSLKMIWRGRKMTQEKCAKNMREAKRGTWSRGEQIASFSTWSEQTVQTYQQSRKTDRVTWSYKWKASAGARNRRSRYIQYREQFQISLAGTNIEYGLKRRTGDSTRRISNLIPIAVPGFEFANSEFGIQNTVWAEQFTPLPDAGVLQSIRSKSDKLKKSLPKY